MANVKDLHAFPLDGEENPVHVRFAPVKELPHFKRKTRGLRSKRATLRK
jgi:hypothetical protein